MVEMLMMWDDHNSFSVMLIPRNRSLVPPQLHSRRQRCLPKISSLVLLTLSSRLLSVHQSSRLLISSQNVVLSLFRIRLMVCCYLQTSKFSSCLGPGVQREQNSEGLRCWALEWRRCECQSERSGLFVSVILQARVLRLPVSLVGETEWCYQAQQLHSHSLSSSLVQCRYCPFLQRWSSLWWSGSPATYFWCFWCWGLCSVCYVHLVTWPCGSGQSSPSSFI